MLTSGKRKDHRLEKYKSNFPHAVDSGASMHMVTKKNLNSAELESMRILKNPTVMPANGEVQTREKATEHVKELDLFKTVMLLEESPAVL